MAHWAVCQVAIAVIGGLYYSLLDVQHMYSCVVFSLRKLPEVESSSAHAKKLSYKAKHYMSNYVYVFA